MKPWLRSLILGVLVPVAAVGKDLAHKWEFITFDRATECAALAPAFTVGSGDKSMGLRLDVRGIPAVFFTTNRLSAWLHRTGGEVVPADPNAMAHPIILGNLGQPQAVATAFFPWGTNSLDESWIEVRVVAETYWLEIPYGFDRDPRLPLPRRASADAPRFCAAMKKSPRDHVIAWKDVHYDLGEIQNHWRLSLILANPGDGEAEVVLYHDPARVGQSIYQWDLYTPRTSVRVTERDGEVTGARCMGIRLHEDGMERSDTFQIGRTGFEDRRSWAQMEVTIAERSYWAIVPSSVYEYAHGHARDD